MANPLSQYQKDVVSQHGEDGIIAEIFNRIGATNKWCVEFGALNGKHHSNVWDLIVNKGWQGVLIEADKTYYDKIAASYEGAAERITTLNRFVSFEGPDRLDALFAATNLPKEFDLLSIDIDGNDYHVWDALADYRPKVVIIECNPTIPNDIAFVQPRDMAVQQGSSLLALVNLAHSKGYCLAATTFGNAFFVDMAVFDRLGFAEPSVDEVNPSTECYTRLYQLYDGTIVLDGYQTLLWHNKPMDVARMQLVPKKYVAGISASPMVRSIKYAVRKLPFYNFLQRLRK